MGPCLNGAHQLIADWSYQVGQALHMVCGLHVAKNLCNNHCYKTCVGFSMIGDTILIIGAVAFFWQIESSISEEIVIDRQ